MTLRYILFAVIPVLMVLAARGRRWPYALMIVLGLAYFPISAGFPLESRACRVAFGWADARMSFANVGHIVLFGVFCLVTLAQFRERNAKAMAWSVAATLAMGAAVEVAQGISGHHNCRLRDLIPDAMGAALAVVLFLAWRRGSRGRG